MKKIFLLTISGLFIFFFQSQDNFSSYALDIFTDRNEIIYCRDRDNCSLEEGTEIVKYGINDIEKNRKASVYIQDVVRYLLTFTTILAVIYIIHAGFKILTSAGNEDEIKKSKTTIMSVLIGMVVIWLAYSIVAFILKVITLN